MRKQQHTAKQNHIKAKHISQKLKHADISFKKTNNNLQKVIADFQNERARYKSILSSIGDGISIQDTKFKILYQNRVHKKHFGSHIGNHCYKAYQQKDRTCKDCPVRMAFTDGKIHTVERTIQNNGKVIYYEVTASSLRDSKKKIVAGIEVVRNITKRKHAEEVLAESEKKFRVLTETAFEGIAVTKNSRFIEISKPFLNLFRYRRNELIGRTPEALIAPSLRKETMQKIRSGYDKPYECLCQRKDGSVFPVEACGKNYSVNGQEFRVTAIRDITERKAAEKAIFESESKYSTLVEKSSDGIVIIQDGLLKFINLKMLEISGYTMKEIIGRPFLDFISSHFKNIVIERYKKRMSGEDVPSKYEIEIIAKNKSIIPVEINASYIEYEGMPADMAIIRDISDRKEMEKELKRKIRELEDFYNIAVARELRMIELKKEIKNLQKDLSTYKKRQ